MRSLRDYGLFLLSRREYSQRDFTNKLKEKGYDIEGIQALVQEFIGAGWLEDRRYAENCIRGLSTGRKSRRQIEQYLFDKGIQGDLIKELLEENWSQDDEVERIRGHIEKIRRSSVEISRDRIIARLTSRGFKVGLVIKCLDEIIE